MSPLDDAIAASKSAAITAAWERQKPAKVFIAAVRAGHAAGLPLELEDGSPLMRIATRQAEAAITPRRLDYAECRAALEKAYPTTKGA